MDAFGNMRLKHRLVKIAVFLVLACSMTMIIAGQAYAAIDEQEPNGSFDMATNIKMNTAVYGAYDSSDDADYYKVELPASGSVTFSFANDKYGSSAFGLLVYNKYYEEVSIDTGNIHQRVWCDKTRPITIQVSLSKGTNYIVIKKGSWTYETLANGQPYHFKLTYNIPGTSIAKITPTKKKFTVKWTKKSGAYKYQVRYSAKKSMAGAKTVNVSNKAKKKTIKAKAKKKYYVQVRVAKKIGGEVYWSKWSAKKAVKTK